MTIQEAAQKANEGGWNEGLKFNCITGLGEIYLDNERGGLYIPKSAAMLDPLFWQALFPACGCDSSVCNDKDDWKDKMIGLTRHLAEGKSIEDYFKNL